MTVLEAYEHVRTRAKESIRKTTDMQADMIKIRLHMGICSMSVQAREVYRVFGEMGSRRRRQLVLMKTGCGGFCSQEPLVEVELPGQKPVIYCNVTPEKARLIFLNHIEQGRVILPWTLDREEVGR
ncbi:MAG: (2Fe-2S) ferredoxin domain-containing protein [Clostridia bacterium]|jgi:NADP-reducing hydrogenase subunit HndB